LSRKPPPPGRLRPRPRSSATQGVRGCRAAGHAEGHVAGGGGGGRGAGPGCVCGVCVGGACLRACLDTSQARLGTSQAGLTVGLHMQALFEI
jgi:hypothetical protein